jgi:hypothetical protein
MMMMLPMPDVYMFAIILEVVEEENLGMILHSEETNE